MKVIKTPLILICISIIFHCCKVNNDMESIDKIFNLIIQDRLKNELRVARLEGTNDTITFEKLILINRTNNIIITDSIYKELTFLDCNCIPMDYSFFKDTTEFLYKQIKGLKSTVLNESIFETNITLNDPEELIEDSAYNTIYKKTYELINRNIDSYSFLQISEPLTNCNGEIFVTTLINTKDYMVYKDFFYENDSNSWNLHDGRTTILKYSEPKFEETINAKGDTIYEESRYIILVGYY